MGEDEAQLWRGEENTGLGITRPGFSLCPNICIPGDLGQVAQLSQVSDAL